MKVKAVNVYYTRKCLFVCVCVCLCALVRETHVWKKHTHTDVLALLPGLQKFLESRQIPAVPQLFQPVPVQVCVCVRGFIFYELRRTRVHPQSSSFSVMRGMRPCFDSSCVQGKPLRLLLSPVRCCFNPLAGFPSVLPPPAAFLRTVNVTWLHVRCK